MAIVEMKHITLLAMRKDQHRLIRRMQKLGCVEITREDAEGYAAYQQSGAEDSATADTLQQIRSLIGHLSRYRQDKSPMLGSKPDAQEEELKAAGAAQAKMNELLTQAQGLERRTGELRGALSRLQMLEVQLQPWEGLDIPVEELRSTRNVLQGAGTVNKAALPALQAALDGLPVTLSVLSEFRDAAYVWYAAHASAKQALDEGLKQAGFTPAALHDFTGTVRDRLSALQQETAQIKAEQQQLEDAWRQMADHVPTLKLYHDFLQIRMDQETAMQQAAVTKEAFLLKGWVPASLAPGVKAELEALSPTAVVEISDPEEGEAPPVMFHNGKLTAPFETIIEGFALPAPNSFDPTALMAPFYACLFGMMLSDAGYGLIMALAIPLFIKLIRPGKNSTKLMWVLFYGALMTVVWGAIYNTWFGFNIPNMTILDPIANPMPVMMLCMVVGLIHLMAGLGMAVYMNIRRGKWLDALYDQISWALLVIGLILLVVGGTAAIIGKWMAIAGVALILLFAKREKKNVFSRILGGLGALYGATSWISDILSYMRLFGMGLATGVVGMVINQLVGMVFSNGIIGMIFGSVLFIAAHTFNLGINALGAYVHACRLQYIEFFGKFYEEGGVAFRPLQYNTRYVNVTPSQKASQ